MRYQENEFYCGPAVVAAAARALGKPVGQQAVAKLAGTTEEGTDEEGIKRALLARGFVPDVLSVSTQLAARNWLNVRLKLGYPVIIALGRQRWEHWTVLVGMLGTRYVLFDPARFEYRVNTGITVYSWASLCRLWYASKRVRGNEPAYYAIAVLLNRPGVGE